MIALLDSSEDIGVCGAELGCDVGQLLTPLTRFRLQYPALPWAMDNGAFSRFDERAFLSLLQREESHKATCLFVTVPDIVGSSATEGEPTMKDLNAAVKAGDFALARDLARGFTDPAVKDAALMQIERAEKAMKA